MRHTFESFKSVCVCVCVCVQGPRNALLFLSAWEKSIRTQSRHATKGSFSPYLPAVILVALLTACGFTPPAINQMCQADKHPKLYWGNYWIRPECKQLQILHLLHINSAMNKWLSKTSTWLGWLLKITYAYMYTKNICIFFKNSYWNFTETIYVIVS